MQDSSSYVRRYSQVPSSSGIRNSTFADNGLVSGRTSLAPQRTLVPIRPSMDVDGMTMSSSRLATPSMRPSLAPGVRRSSIMNRRMSSASFMGQAASTSSMKDPRPLTDKRYQQECAAYVVNFLLECGYPQPLTPNNRFLPTTKEFASIFKFLYNKLDPKFRFGARYEEDVINCLKSLRYPFTDSISRSRLVAIGTPHSWPAILGMLHWLVCLIQCTEQAVDMAYSVENDTLNDHFVNKVLFDYLVRKYHLFLQASMEEEPEQELKASFEEQNKEINTKIQLLQQENDELLKQKQAAGDLDSTIELLEERFKTMQRDEVKLQSFMSSIQSRMESKTALKKQIQLSLTEKEAQLQELNEKKKSLKSRVDMQSISTAEFQKMMSEQEQLDRNINFIGNKITELRKEVFDKDLLVQSKIDTLEKESQKYSNLAYRIGIIPPTAPRAGNGNFEVILDPETGSINLDLKNYLRPFLNQVRHSITLEFHEEQNKSLKIQEVLDALNDTVAELQDELNTIESRLNSVVKECTMLRESANQEKASLNTESQKLEHDLQQLKLSSHNSMLQLDQRIQTITIEADQLAHSCMEYKNNVYREVAYMLSEIIQFKLYIQDSLEGLEMDYMKEFEELRAKLE
ncbi:spindle pole body protein Ndc80 [Schizosaccharomyces cryophilus OY26]|uniref:Kinetochore protein NDC80 n=1 Tax=Schizosaccharomyces cryophilus (strain OY26 / ATCC MYA-4695 / CBS 11777 / NBRC 106824 / NRRL Y48691) TaxID=653667 RepID=S9X0X7_SCHCR|nr:spindle pole body protein Ndc80 [Schizosaccharomyces cryophilus OY26]EPY50657.1 spindle pole body protein Ndc80 [Schizosaccharomyces cryophilus OY26]